MLKKSIIIGVFLICLTKLSGLESPVFKMDVSANFGMMNGSISEYVFDKYCKNTDNMLSRLDWDITTVPYGQIDVSIDLFKYIYIGASGVMGIPVSSGFMQDYDWLNSVSNNPSWLKDDPTELTNYSKHDNKADEFYNFSFKAGGNIPLSRKFVMNVYAGYKYDFIKMSAYDGFFDYKSFNFQRVYAKDMPDLPEGRLISYLHELNSFFTGIGFNCNFIPRIFIKGYFQIAPLGKLVALDCHYARGNEGFAFLDIYSRIFIMEGEITASYKINRHNKIGLKYYNHFMPLIKGITGTGNMINGTLPDIFKGSTSAQGGAKRFMFGLSLVYNFSF